MTDTSDITDAAIAEVLMRVNSSITVRHIRRYPADFPAYLELARMIQKYEPPVDRAEELYACILSRAGRARRKPEEWDIADRAAIELLRQHMKDEA